MPGSNACEGKGSELRSWADPMRSANLPIGVNKILPRFGADDMPSQLIHIPSWPRWAALSLLFLSFITVTYERAKARNTSNALDQDLDLTLGLKIRHFEALSDGYHHPLLPAL